MGPPGAAGRRRRGAPSGLAALPSPPGPRLHRDPDNVTFCVLAADAEDEGDIALQIHFTLIQAFCCENDIDIVRVGDVQRLAAIVGAGDEAAAPGDLHCILISVSAASAPASPRRGQRPAASQADLCVLPAEPQ